MPERSPRSKIILTLTLGQTRRFWRTGLSDHYQIRQFADLAGVTVKALHHYDRLGLLRPKRSRAGYRVYYQRDLGTLEQIVALKFLGLPLKEIAAVLERPALKWRDTLRLQRQALEERQELLGRAIHAIAVRRFLPELPRYADGISVADLLHHTSGLRDVGPLLEITGRAEESLDVAGSLKLLERQTALNFAPGAEYEYTNSDYLLLGALVERVTGMTLSAYAEERLFLPLRMANTQFLWASPKNCTTALRDMPSAGRAIARSRSPR